MVFGSFVNFPVYRIRHDVIRITRNDSPGQNTCIPCSSCNIWDTVISCNLGGAILPAGISVYLLYQAILMTGTSLVITVCEGIIIVATITFVTTRTIPGVGIHIPLLIPGFTALLAGLILSGGAGLTASCNCLCERDDRDIVRGKYRQSFPGENAGNTRGQYWRDRDFWSHLHLLHPAISGCIIPRAIKNGRHISERKIRDHSLIRNSPEQIRTAVGGSRVPHD